MPPTATIEALVAAGRAEDYAAVVAFPGAGVHAQVLRFSDALCRGGKETVKRLSALDSVAFAKALAVYEDTVGGLGSVTALERVLPLVKDEDHSVLNWILSKPRSYWYHSHGAKSFAELQSINSASAARRAENEQREVERERTAKDRKAEQASANLLNAVRRGDIKAVEALLSRGATAHGVTTDGVPLVQYAEELNRTAIADLLRHAQGGASAALYLPKEGS